jgi:cardiolipin synthase
MRGVVGEDSFMQLYFVVLGYLLTFAFIPVVLARKRQANSAIAWCLSIVLLPGLGTILFLIFGIAKVNRRLRRKQFHRALFIQQWVASGCDEGDVFEHDPNPSGWEGMDRLACAVGAVRVSAGNELTLYSDGVEAFEAKLAAIRDAQYHVHAEYYIVRHDDAGLRMLDLMCDRARAGIEVRLLVDAIGSSAARKIVAKIKACGGQAHRFLPIAPFRRRFVLNLRNHRKILVCDGKTAFTGGLNIGNEYLGQSRFGHWRDTHARISGPAALGLQRVFVEDWDFASGQFLSGSSYFPDPRTDGDNRLQIVWSGPDQTQDAMHEVYFGAINRSQRRLWITTPYLVPPGALLAGLRNAALRGVDVRILTQSSPPDTWIAYLAARYYWPDLIRSGVKIFEYSKGMIHAKTMVVDDAWASVGSANMDVRSLSLNFEANCLIHTPRTVETLGEHFLADLENARAVDMKEIEQRAWYKLAAENFCRLLSPIL